MEDNIAVIFTEPDTKQLERYSKRVLTARVLIYCCAAFFGAWAIVALIMILTSYNSDLEKDDSIVVLECFLPIALCYLATAILSYRKPSLFILIATILNGIMLFMSAIGFYLFEKDHPFLSCAIILAQLFVISLLIMGLVSANRHKKMRLKNI